MSAHLGHPVRVLLLALSSIALLLVALPSTASAQIESGGSIPDRSTDGFANFRTFCEFSHAAYDDPIVYPGEPGAAHLHFFFGNTRTNAFSTPASLKARGGSTCQGIWANRSAYWIPAVFSAEGRPMTPDFNNIYYKHLSDEPEAKVKALPAGLQMISGNTDGTPEHDQFQPVFWRCGSNYDRSDTIPDCPVGDSLVMEVSFPPCWDGENLDSADHRSHMAHVRYNGQGESYCPSSHPVPVPQIIMIFDWELRDSTSNGWYLSSDMGRPNGSTLHADWMNGWAPQIQRTWHQECIVELRNCIAGELGDGRILEPTLALGSRKIPLPRHNRTEPAWKYCNGRLATIVGTAGPDVITGTPGDDVIVGLAGDDRIVGGGGNDIVCGGPGHDMIDGGPGNDELRGQDGNDKIFGSAGDDYLDGATGNDDLRGHLGNDTLRGGSGDDTLTEFGDRNLLMGHGGNDVIIGGWWIDIMYGGGGNDTITGTGGPDRIYGGRGTDQCDTADRIYNCE